VSAPKPDSRRRALTARTVEIFLKGEQVRASGLRKKRVRKLPVSLHLSHPDEADGKTTTQFAASGFSCGAIGAFVRDLISGVREVLSQWVFLKERCCDTFSGEGTD
jgi:hypothetical protein